MADAKSRFFLAQDNDCHWYMVEAIWRGEWEEWLESGSDEVPQYATPLGSGPQWVEFENPEFV